MVDERRHGAHYERCACGSGCYRHARRHASCSVVTRNATCGHLWELLRLNVTVPVEEFPPATLVGFSESEERGGRGGGAGAT